MLRPFTGLAAVVGLWMAQALPAQEPTRLDLESGDPSSLHHVASANQRIADTIADHLRQSGHLHRYNIDIVFADGTAVLSGCVSDQLQHDEAVRIAQGVPGVDRVRDYLALGGQVAITPAQAAAPAVPEPVPPPRKDVTVGGDGPVVEPMPAFAAVGGPSDLNPPKMPPYAWPTYAPYNNYSRVAYPLLYPYQSWPYIGPVYPFPKIPLGWRKVKLEWQDGHWFYSTHSNSHDWWRLRYW